MQKYFRNKLRQPFYYQSRRLPLFNAIRKYGPDVFTVEPLICSESKEQLDSLEKFFIRTCESQTTEYGYNVASGGMGGVGCKRSDEHIAAIRKAQLGNKHNLGRKPSEKQLSALMKNSFCNRSDFDVICEKAKDSRRRNGWIISKETKAKISATTQGKSKSEITKQKMREAFLKRTTHEQRCAMSKAANAARWRS